MTVRFLTVGEVATRLGVSGMTVYRLVQSKALKAIKVGRVIRISEPELAKYIEGQSE